MTTSPPGTSGAPILCGSPTGCNCTTRCEFPCWQRAGLTTHPCCPTCRPLDLEPDDQDRAHERTDICPNCRQPDNGCPCTHPWLEQPTPRERREHLTRNNETAPGLRPEAA